MIFQLFLFFLCYSVSVQIPDDETCMPQEEFVVALDNKGPYPKQVAGFEITNVSRGDSNACCSTGAVVMADFEFDSCLSCQRNMLQLQLDMAHDSERELLVEIQSMDQNSTRIIIENDNTSLGPECNTNVNFNSVVKNSGRQLTIYCANKLIRAVNDKSEASRVCDDCLLNLQQSPKVQISLNRRMEDSLPADGNAICRATFRWVNPGPSCFFND